MESTWSITELAEMAALALADEPVRVNGRVRDQPNERLIRWYTTIGLVDPPLGRRGRTALYGQRHLLQLVAVKRRQAAGRTIAEIQAELTGATDETLRRIAGLTETTGPTGRPGRTGRPAHTAQGAQPAHPTETDGHDGHDGRHGHDGQARGTGDAAHGGTAGQPRRFWTSAPAGRDRTPPTARTGTRTGDQAIVAAAEDRAAGPPAELVAALRLAPGVTIVLDHVPAGWPPAPERLAALRAAAGPLLAELRASVPGTPSAPSTPTPDGRAAPDTSYER